jgi:hypothetical protein
LKPEHRCSSTAEMRWPRGEGLVGQPVGKRSRRAAPTSCMVGFQSLKSGVMKHRACGYQGQSLGAQAGPGRGAGQHPDRRAAGSGQIGGGVREADDQVHGAAQGGDVVEILLQVDARRLPDVDAEFRLGQGDLLAAVAVLQIDEGDAWRSRTGRHCMKGENWRARSPFSFRLFHSSPTLGPLGALSSARASARPAPDRPRGSFGRSGKAATLGRKVSSRSPIGVQKSMPLQSSISGAPR